LRPSWAGHGDGSDGDHQIEKVLHGWGPEKSNLGELASAGVEHQPLASMYARI
jgi:hypothetical protein